MTGEEKGGHSWKRIVEFVEETEREIVGEKNVEEIARETLEKTGWETGSTVGEIVEETVKENSGKTGWGIGSESGGEIIEDVGGEIIEDDKEALGGRRKEENDQWEGESQYNCKKIHEGRWGKVAGVGQRVRAQTTDLGHEEKNCLDGY